MAFRVLLAVDGKVSKCLYGRMSPRKLSIKMVLEVFGTYLCQKTGAGMMGWAGSGSCVPLHYCSPSAIGGNWSAFNVPRPEVILTGVSVY